MAEEDLLGDEEVEQIIETGKTIEYDPNEVVYADKASEPKKRKKTDKDKIVDPQEEIGKIIKEEQLQVQSKPQPKPEPKLLEQTKKPVLTAHDILTKSEEEIKRAAQVESKRETYGLLQDLKIITAILLGKKQNKDLSKVLDTDKSFTSKQVKGLEEQGLIKKEVQGREVHYEVDQFNVMKFLQTKVVIKVKDTKKVAQSEQSSAAPRGKAASEETKKDGK